MKKWFQKHTGLAFRAIAAVVILLTVFGLNVSVIGYICFTASFKDEYSESTYHMADAATTLINSDSLDDYLKGEKADKYAQTRRDLYAFCDKMNVTMVYVIKVDRSDYGRFVSVFNAVNNDVGGSSYTEWPLGYQRDTTNDEYREHYRLIYEKKEDYATIFRMNTSDGQLPHVTTLVPVEKSNGDVAAILCVHRPMSELIGAHIDFWVTVFVSTVIISTLASVFAAIYIKKRLAKPIKTVADEAVRFATENIKGEPLGNISGYAELQNLASSIDKMETDMTAYMEELTAVTAEKERINTELSVAAKIQENSIPNVFPAFPDRTEFDIFASMTPAKDVGGDFYNFFFIDDDHLALVIGDVSDKGIPAALFMMVTNILISDRTVMGGTPAEILNFVNVNVCSRNKAQMFVTLWLGILELSTGKVIAANAGHDDAAICRKNGGFALHKTKHGLVTGAISETVYKDFEFLLEPGDKLFLYTDGLPEATDTSDNAFTLERMLGVLNGCRDGSPEEIITAVHAGVSAFTDGNDQFDDLTMLCLVYNGAQRQDTLSVRAEMDNVPLVTDFIDRFLEPYHCTAKQRKQLELALEEAFVNIVHYAYSDNPGGVDITLSGCGNELTISITDSGVPFDPLKKDDPDFSVPGEKRRIGGLGIYMMKRIADTLEYRYENRCNRLIMKKKL